MLKILFSFAGYISERMYLFQSVTFLTQQSSHQFIQCKEFERDEYVSKVTIVTDLFSARTLRYSRETARLCSQLPQVCGELCH